ncbi:MAG: protein kinase [Streptomyces sp.]|nr:protein kinase [Streptomyces sp.]
MQVGFVESGAALVSRCSARVLAGRYRLDAVIGSGGAADVHRGFDLRLRRPVAVKVFRHGTGFDSEEDFRREAQILARLEHPAVVSAYDTGRHGADGYLVVQLVDGPTLKARIAEGPLPWQTAAVLGAGLADALAHAHGQGVVHRDVKPSNILLDSSGRPYLSDFGISCLLDATTRAAPGALTGTAAYLSPEQVMGRPVDQPADVYALGLVLLECLTGRLEYGGAPLEAAIARLHRPPRIPASVPAEFTDLLRHMTDLDEHARPGADDCARSLSLLAARTGPGTEAAPSGMRPHEIPSPLAASGAGLALAPDVARSDTTTAASEKPGVTAPARHRVRMAGAAVAVAASIVAFAVIEGTAGHTTGGEQATPVTSHTPAEDTPTGTGAAPADEQQPVAPRAPTGTAAGQGTTGLGGQPGTRPAQADRAPTLAHPPAAPGTTKADEPRGQGKHKAGGTPGKSGSAEQGKQRHRP